LILRLASHETRNPSKYNIKRTSTVTNKAVSRAGWKIKEDMKPMVAHERDKILLFQFLQRQTAESFAS
jgi:hypothetical protein